MTSLADCPLPLAHPALSARLRRHSGRAWLAACLVLLVLAQALGLMHRVAHLPGLLLGQPQMRQAPLSDAYAPASRHLLPVDAAQHSHERHWTDALFEGHGDADCRLLDVLAQPACPTAPPPTSPPQLAAVQLAFAPADFIARRAALFEARGPPVAR